MSIGSNWWQLQLDNLLWNYSGAPFQRDNLWHVSMRRLVIISCAPHHPADFINGYSHQDFQRPIAAPVRLILREVLRGSKSTRWLVMRDGSWGHGGHGSWDSSSPSCHAQYATIFSNCDFCVAHSSNWGCPKIPLKGVSHCVSLKNQHKNLRGLRFYVTRSLRSRTFVPWVPGAVPRRFQQMSTDPPVPSLGRAATSRVASTEKSLGVAECCSLKIWIGWRSEFKFVEFSSFFWGGWILIFLMFYHFPSAVSTAVAQAWNWSFRFGRLRSIPKPWVYRVYWVLSDIKKHITTLLYIHNYHFSVIILSLYYHFTLLLYIYITI